MTGTCGCVRGVRFRGILPSSSQLTSDSASTYLTDKKLTAPGNLDTNRHALLSAFVHELIFYFPTATWSKLHNSHGHPS